MGSGCNEHPLASSFQFLYHVIFSLNASGPTVFCMPSLSPCNWYKEFRTMGVRNTNMSVCLSISRFICKNNGVLFENQLLQIGLKSEFRQNLGKLSNSCRFCRCSNFGCSILGIVHVSFNYLVTTFKLHKGGSNFMPNLLERSLVDHMSFSRILTLPPPSPPHVIFGS